MTRALLRFAIWLGLLLAAGAAQAHESRPAYLEINELGAHRYSVLWRTPLNAGTPLPVRLELPPGVSDVSPPAERELSDSLIERHLIKSPDGLEGKRIAFVGLQGTITDVLVRIQLANGIQSTILVHPSKAWVEIPREQGSAMVAKTYVQLGIEHIWFGFDHLLFVAALFMLVANLRTLFWTITSFTAAHSITLALVTLDVIRVPIPPVEAFIALSIVFVAVEVVRQAQGHPTLASRKPWLVAFSFGLLHGLGFASALAQIGLPPNNVPLALLFFNVGVEIGQIVFVCALLLVSSLARRFAGPMQISTARLVSCYGIGGMASYWLFDRIANFI